MLNAPEQNELVRAVAGNDFELVKQLLLSPKVGSAFVLQALESSVPDKKIRILLMFVNGINHGRLSESEIRELHDLCPEPEINSRLNGAIELQNVKNLQAYSEILGVTLSKSEVSSLIAKAPVGVYLSQVIILQKLQKYMEQDSRRDKDFIRKFFEGFCGGISSLWLYSRWLSFQPKISDRPRDDYAWFKLIVELIVGWDGIRSLTSVETENFERFISQIEFFQNTSKYLPVTQGLLDKSMEDDQRDSVGKFRHPIREYSIASLFTLEQLKTVLQ